MKLSFSSKTQGQFINETSPTEVRLGGDESVRTGIWVTFLVTFFVSLLIFFLVQSLFRKLCAKDKEKSQDVNVSFLIQLKCNRTRSSAWRANQSSTALTKPTIPGIPRKLPTR